MAKSSSKKRQEKTVRGSARSAYVPIIRPEPKTKYDFSDAFKVIKLKDDWSPEALDRELQIIAQTYEEARQRASREVLPSEESKQLKALGQLLHRANNLAKSLRRGLFHIPGDSTGGLQFRADLEAIVDRIDRINARRQTTQTRESVSAGGFKTRPGPGKDYLMQLLLRELAGLWTASSGKLVPFSSNKVSFAEFVFAVTCAMRHGDVTMTSVKTNIRNWYHARS